MVAIHLQNIKSFPLNYHNFSCLGRLNSIQNQIMNCLQRFAICPPVAFKEVCFCHVLPPHGGLDALGRHPVAKLGNVFGVPRLQHCVLKHPELLPCKLKQGKETDIKSWTTSNSWLPSRSNTQERKIYSDGFKPRNKMAGRNLLPFITVLDVDVHLIENRSQTGWKVLLAHKCSSFPTTETNNCLNSGRILGGLL